MSHTESTLARLRRLALDCAISLDRAGHIHAPEDAEILALCERLGFGAVMDSASRQWLLRDPVGAFTVGPCAVTVSAAYLKALKDVAETARVYVDEDPRYVEPGHPLFHVRAALAALDTREVALT